MSVDLGSVILDIPDDDTPGYWERQERLTGLQIALLEAQSEYEKAKAKGDNVTGDEALKVLKQVQSAFQALTEYIIGFISIPKDPEEKRRIIRSLSKSQFEAVRARIQEGDKTENPTSPDGSGDG